MTAPTPDATSILPPLALLAGGLATRMRPLTERVPKSLLEVAGEPFIAHQLRLFRREGVRRVVVCAGYLAEQVIDFVGNGGRFGLDVVYSLDRDRQLGTGGALRKALPLLGPEFLVTYGDSYLDIPYAPLVAAFRASGCPALMSVFRNDGQWDTSNVEFTGGRIRAYDKRNQTPGMCYIDYGLLMMTARVLAARTVDAPFDLAGLCEQLVRDGQLAGAEVAHRFYEIGSAEGLAETDALLRARG